MKPEEEKLCCKGKNWTNLDLSSETYFAYSYSVSEQDLLLNLSQGSRMEVL